MLEPFEASVTFEFETAKPVTAKVTVQARKPGPAARRAIELAAKALSSTRGWRSLVVVLERPSAPVSDTPEGVTAVIDGSDEEIVG